MDYLVSKGISSSRMTSKGYGETRPTASNDTDEGRKQNRRAQIEPVK
jgi:outer membrane protein OmpA-like peptidoglycan-associated protein